MDGFIESPKGEGRYYHINIQSLECSCMDFAMHRKRQYSVDNPNRLCKHLIKAMSDNSFIPEQLLKYKDDISWFAVKGRGFSLEKESNLSDIVAEGDIITKAVSNDGKSNYIVEAEINGVSLFLHIPAWQNDHVVIEVDHYFIPSGFNADFSKTLETALPKKYRHFIPAINFWASAEFISCSEKYKVENQDLYDFFVNIKYLLLNANSVNTKINYKIQSNGVAFYIDGNRKWICKFNNDQRKIEFPDKIKLSYGCINEAVELFKKYHKQ